MNASNPSSSYVDSRYPLSDITARIIAAAQTVHRTLGPGFKEVFYQRALALELPGHHLDFEREVWINVFYTDHLLGRLRVDFVIEGVLVEIKAKHVLEGRDVIQTLSYLKASGFKIGLLLNFGSDKLTIKRLAN